MGRNERDLSRRWVLNGATLPENALALNTREIDGIPETILVLEYGTTDTTKGPYIVDEAGVDNVIATAQAKGKDIVFDYEHQTLFGDRAPAAGWIPLSGMRKTKKGLEITVAWTKAAAEYLSNREYRYYSPVVVLDDSGRVIELHSVGLTNDPATINLEPLVAKNGHGEKHKGETMNELLLKVLKALGLDLDLKALEGMEEKQVMEKVTTALTALKVDDKPDIPEDLATALDLKDKTVSEAVATVHALKQGKEQLSELEKVQNELKDLKAEAAKRDAAEAVEMALTAGKIQPSQKEWAMDYATKDLAGFKSFADKAPQIVPLDNLGAGPGTPGGGGSGVTNEVDAVFDNDPAEVDKVGV